MELAQKIRQLRKKKRFTQGELANYLNVSPAYISQLELGIRHPSLNLIQKIAHLFEVNVSYLMDDNGETVEEVLSDSHIRRIINLARQSNQMNDLEEYLRWKAEQAKGNQSVSLDMEQLELPEDLQVYFRTKKLSEEDRQELVSLIRWWCSNRQKPTP